MHIEIYEYVKGKARKFLQTAKEFICSNVKAREEERTKEEAEPQAREGQDN